MSTDHQMPAHSAAQTDWIEQSAIPSLGFRIWHVILLCASALLTIIILICCCVKIRIPRTKQEIEADYQRKKIARKFRERLHLIQNQDMDNMDLKLALERVQTDFDNETRKLMENHAKYNINDISTFMLSGSVALLLGTMKAEPQQPLNLENTTKISTIFPKLDSNNTESNAEKTLLSS